jgi:hypothetical protein
LEFSISKETLAFSPIPYTGTIPGELNISRWSKAL